MSTAADYRELSDRRHALHLWINRRRNERRKAGEGDREGSLYAWTDMESERERFPHILKAAFEGTLPTTHQFCSRTEPEPIAENRLICGLGQEVTTCPILLSLRETFDGRQQELQRLQERMPTFEIGLIADSVYEAMATVCTWHIFTTKFAVPAGHGRIDLDLSEGWAKDESERRFWARTYELMSADLDGPDGEP